MAYIYTFPNATTPDAIAVQLSSQVTGLFPFLFLFVWMIVFLGGTVRQKSRVGTADYPMWSVVASLSTFIVACLLSVVSGFISLSVFAIILVINFFCGAWLFLDRRISEG